jgi:hypothetical protein
VGDVRSRAMLRTRLPWGSSLLAERWPGFPHLKQRRLKRAYANASLIGLASERLSGARLMDVLLTRLPAGSSQLAGRCPGFPQLKQRRPQVRIRLGLRLLGLKLRVGGQR